MRNLRLMSSKLFRREVHRARKGKRVRKKFERMTQVHYEYGLAGIESPFELLWIEAGLSRQGAHRGDLETAEKMGRVIAAENLAQCRLFFTDPCLGGEWDYRRPGMRWEDRSPFSRMYPQVWCGSRLHEIRIGDRRHTRPFLDSKY